MDFMPQEKINRRGWLKVAGGTIAGLAIGGAMGYLAKPSPLPLTMVTTETVTVSATERPMTSATVSLPSVELPAWQWGAEYDSVNKALDAIAGEWNAAHPDALVKYTMFPELSEAEYALKVKQAAGAGIPPALFYMTDTTILTDLAFTGYVEEPPSDVLDTVKAMTDPAYQYMLNMYSPTGETKCYAAGVIVGISCVGLFCNRKLFQEVGLDPNKLPQTWDELRDAAKALVKRDSNGKMLRSGYSVRRSGNPGGIGEKFVPFPVGNGANILWKDGGKWHTDINEKPVVEAAQFLHDLIYVDRVDDPDFPSWGYDPYLNETCAISGPSGVGFVTNAHFAKPEMVSSIGVTNVPSPGGIKTASSFGDEHVLAVCSKATDDQKSRAWDFLRFFNTPANITKVSNDIWNWTAYKDALSTPPFSTENSWKDMNNVLSSVGRPHVVNEYGPGWLSMTTTLGNNLSRAFANEISVKDALDRTYNDWTDYMKSSTFYS
jgi:ABC-type glycerol-3-phosphate transport system substrate-binding protein